jgi:hypothetical protein
LDNTLVEMRDLGHAYSPMGASIEVTGRARTNIFSGASSGQRTSYDVSDGARLLVRDMWYESGETTRLVNVHGAAVFTMDSVRLASPGTGPPVVNISDLGGSVALLGVQLDNRIAVSGDGRQGRVLAAALFHEQASADYLLNQTSPAGAVLLVNGRHRRDGGPGNRSVPTEGGMSDPAFIRALMAQTRTERPTALTVLPSSTTDLRMYRVWLTDGLTNLTLSK